MPVNPIQTIKETIYDCTFTVPLPPRPVRPPRTGRNRGAEEDYFDPAQVYDPMEANGTKHIFIKVNEAGDKPKFQISRSLNNNGMQLQNPHSFCEVGIVELYKALLTILATYNLSAVEAPEGAANETV